MKIANKHILKKIHHLLSIDRRDLGVGLSQFLMFKTSFVRLDTPDIRSTFQKSKKKNILNPTTIYYLILF